MGVGSSITLSDEVNTILQNSLHVELLERIHSSTASESEKKQNNYHEHAVSIRDSMLRMTDCIIIHSLNTSKFCERIVHDFSHHYFNGLLTVFYFFKLRLRYRFRLVLSMENGSHMTSKIDPLG